MGDDNPLSFYSSPVSLSEIVCFLASFFDAAVLDGTLAGEPADLLIRVLYLFTGESPS